MTTPENFKRRQQLELRGLFFVGVCVLIVGVTQIVTTHYFRNQDAAQRACFARNFHQLTVSLTARGNIAQREARATKLEGKATRIESSANNAFYRSAFAATNQSEVFDAYGTYRVALHEVNIIRMRVDHRRERIAEDRADQPIPDFPAGTCDA